ncbi:hypothetical protein [Paraburkholderia youngii]|uniref:Uncharacterized protein n=1 Tax=Paraburkholderia youngii TaxID=2782701 RepID=A0A7W8NZ80_9BURK|nr:hypothetical protein [Paraburkholderia youngii]MBB5398759.1 hypothetical protein [Paraburkholderia youngii]
MRSRTTVAVMSLSRSVIGCEVGGGSMRLKTFQQREYCGERENFFPEKLPIRAMKCGAGLRPLRNGKKWETQP